MIDDKEKILGIDYGDFTIGLAIYDVDDDFIYPLKTIWREKANVLRKSIREIVDIIKKEKIGVIVVGLPLNFDGSVGNRVTLVMNFVHMLINKFENAILYDQEKEYIYNNGKLVEIEELNKNINTKVIKKIYMQDERLTTIEASQILTEREVKKSEQKKVIDQVAAEIILQEFKNQKIKNQILKL